MTSRELSYEAIRRTLQQLEMEWLARLFKREGSDSDSRRNPRLRDTYDDYDRGGTCEYCGASVESSNAQWDGPFVYCCDKGCAGDAYDRDYRKC
jgi:hypothetical protein